MANFRELSTFRFFVINLSSPKLFTFFVHQDPYFQNKNQIALRYCHLPIFFSHNIPCCIFTHTINHFMSLNQWQYAQKLNTRKVCISLKNDKMCWFSEAWDTKFNLVTPYFYYISVFTYKRRSHAQNIRHLALLVYLAAYVFKARK